MNNTKNLRYLHPLLEPPKEAFSLLLPHEKLSVLDLLAFKIPVVVATKNDIPATVFFSMDQPSLLDITLLQDLPVPSSETLQDLAELSVSLLDNGARSLQCAHFAEDLGTKLPCWVLTYWCEVMTLRTKYLEPWIQARENLERRDWLWKDQEKEGTQTLIDKVYNALNSVLWSANIRGFSNTERTVTLATYCTDEWLSDIQENQMLDLLQRRL
ncbi:uncharacterized protein F5891DRAFT_1240510 [Suillus fuscotomentosus]|uniref:Uncharacterized protein n=1 Tax=Suillus fuscotomentosus TaxID=1912939 RepID=A0AAD4HIS7_9AGAM|nr:uncharacterized protein F5891DRAFT_1240510 [Suillus fuscotomentosus]KAG1898062.1 hypothetical protein F5891DRAFT_1240510 [Suillus fuscotomentosus]